MSGSRIPGSNKGSTRREVFGPDHYQTYQQGRAIKSCLECRRRKMRCSRSQPCQNCGRFQRECVYLPSPACLAIPSPDARADDVHSLGFLDTSDQDGNSPTYVHDTPSWQEPSMRRGSALERDPKARHDGLYGIDANDDSLDKGLQIGRLRITDRIGGLFRPEFGKRLSMLLAQNNDLLPPRDVLPSSTATLPQHYNNLQCTSSAALHGTPLEASTGLLLSTSQLPGKSWENYFPTREEGKLLYYQYFAAVDPLAHILHKPSFAFDYYSLTSRSSNTQLTPSFKALLLAIYFAAAVSLPLMQCEIQLGIQQQVLVDKLKAATEKALIDANYLSSVKLETLQAFTVYIIPQCREEVSQSHTKLVGALVRLAECAGLHRGGGHLGTTPTESQVRRLLWHQICFLDIRTAESQGPQPTVREEADTPLPWNVDDTEVDDASRRVSNTGWTDATFSLMRYECYMVHRLIFRQRIAIDNQKIDLATGRREVAQRKCMIEDKYLRHLDERVPIQRCAKLVGQILTARFDPMLLQRHLQDGKKRSDAEHELQHTLIKCGLKTCESAAILETTTDLAPWAWYVGAYQQYHQAVWLLMEVYRNPHVAFADRINAVLDFVFGRAAGSSSIERNRDTLRLLAEECTIYMQLRKAKTAEALVGERSSPNVNTRQLPPATQLSTEASTVPQLNINATTRQLAPAPQIVDECQAIYDWQPTMDFETNPTQCFPAPDMSDWTNISPYQSSSGNSINSMAGDFWTDDFQPVSSAF